MAGGACPCHSQSSQEKVTIGCYRSTEVCVESGGTWIRGMGRDGLLCSALSDPCHQECYLQIYRSDSCEFGVCELGKSLPKGQVYLC